MAAHRILILTNRIPYPLTDGGNMAMHAMIQGYHNAGWEVYLLAMHTSRHTVEYRVLKGLYPWLAGFETVDVDNRIKPVPTLVNLIFSKHPNHAARFFNHSFRKKLDEVLQSFRPGVVQMESIFLATYLPFIRQAGNIVNVMRLHNIEYQVWERLAEQVRNVPKRLYIRNLAKRIRIFEEQAWKDFDVLLPITGVDAAIVRESGANTELVVAPFGIDIAPHKESEDSEEWVGYHIGAMDWLPNAEAMNWFLQEVWPELHEAVPQFRFYFAGRNMPARFRNISLPGVTCMGEVPDAHAFIADKKILIVPLMSAGGIRVKILEAMAKGKVIISTSIGMQGINAVPGIHYVEANDAKTFIIATKWVLEHRDEACKIARQGADLVAREYRQEAIMQKVIHGIERHIR